VSIRIKRLHRPSGHQLLAGSLAPGAAMATERPVLAGHRGGGLGPHMTTPGLRGRARLALRLAGGGLLIATGAIHLDLYLTGYRSIPTIGWLFLLQIIVAFGLGVVVLASGEWLAAAAGAVFALATLGGYLLTLWIGLFGFTEVRTTAGIVAGVIEVAAFAALAGLAAMSAERGQGGAGLLASLRAGVPGHGRVITASVAVVSVVALAVLGGSAAAAGSSAATAAGGTLQTVRIGGVMVLANAKGLTLYSFAPDTATRSACSGTCAVYWPPVTGPVTAGPGITGKLATIKRSDGSSQATYDGHPLYTYVGDSAAGQANGNNLNLNGGLWREVPASG
jgi:predicted lipoprotein with Yx(FWY)xxD motif